MGHAQEGDQLGGGQPLLKIFDPSLMEVRTLIGEPDSIALRIPNAFAREVRAEAGKAVDLSVQDGKLVVTPIEAPVYTLDELLSGITPENLHGETFAVAPVGKEIV